MQQENKYGKFGTKDLQIIKNGKTSLLWYEKVNQISVYHNDD